MHAYEFQPKYVFYVRGGRYGLEQSFLQPKWLICHAWGAWQKWNVLVAFPYRVD